MTSWSPLSWSPARQDALLAAAAFVMGLVLLAGGALLDRGRPLPLLALPLALTCAAVVVRRRAPVVTLALGVTGMAADVVLGPSLGTILVFTDNLYAAALYGPRPLGRTLLWITSAGAVLTGAAAWFVTGDWRTLALFPVQAALIGVVPVSTANVIRQHRDQAVAERERAEQVARLAELDRQAAIAGERTRMARELHDLVSNHFSAIAIQSSALLVRQDLDAAAVRKVMKSIRENSVQGMAEMRTMIGLLRHDGEGEEAEPIRRRLADAADLIDRTGVRARLTVRGTSRPLPPAVDLAAYRILQEALTNVLKHGGADAEVVIEYAPDRVVLIVENPVDRDSPSTLPGAGAGLVGMRERTALVGGSFDAGPLEAMPPYDTGQLAAVPLEAGPSRGTRWRMRAELPTGSPA
ncbi:sensor histidine kinase [Sphaerimonospora thailandensis]|uniref:histidine kinase n=1 Tax=Sphaerimonospora thailandensis TaxID=795644 RepID=A0A8J3RI40_9ACTN|nr:histidine kinase [Sphaerimonospora thailandensis]GIH72778.1 two-component sensor histidine kinase [Sphaerimonospora thailandensis]